VLNRLVYGVGTNLVTSEGSPALGGVYKLVAVRQAGEWVPAIKVSEMPLKTPNPGQKQGWRIYDRRGMATADLLSLEDEDPRQADEIQARHPSDQAKSRTIKTADIGEIEPLLVDVLKEGKQVYDLPSIEGMRQRRSQDIARLDIGVRRLLNPHVYHVSLTGKLWDLKQALIQSALKSN
jgi:nicotinate phosphoribosyltransferase